MSLFSSRAVSRGKAADKENNALAASTSSHALQSKVPAKLAGVSSRLKTQPVGKAARPTTASAALGATRRPLAAGAEATNATSVPPATTPGRGAALSASMLGTKSVAKPRGAAATNGNAAPSAADFGLPALADELRSVFTSDVREDYGVDYQGVLARKIPKKNSSISYKEHDAFVKQLLDDCRSALTDMIARRERAIATAQRLEREVAAKFTEAAALQGRLQELQATKGAADSQIVDLRNALAAVKDELAVAQRNESEANNEIDEANGIIHELENAKTAAEAKVAELQGELVDRDAINKGLEDDKDDLTQQIKALKAQLSNIADVHTKEMANLQRAGAEYSAAATVKINALTEESAKLTADLKAAQRSIQDLERASTMSEVDVAKIRSERDAANEAKAALAFELERVRKQLDIKESSMNATMETFNRNQELQMQRERDMSRNHESLLERLSSITTERDSLRATETVLKADLRDALAREEKLQQELTNAQLAKANLADQLSTLRGEAARLAQELAALQTKLDKTAHEAAAAREEMESNLAMVQAKLLAAEDRLAIASEKQAAWEAKEQAWAVQQQEVSVARAAAEDQVASLSRELETLRESAGATEESQLDKLCQVSKEAETLRRRVREMADLKARLASHEAELIKLREEVFSGEMARRALHNQVQELKGNIRVYVRVRPALSVDADPGAMDEEDACENAAVDDVDIAIDDSVEESSKHAQPSSCPVEIETAITCGLDETSLEMATPPSRSTKEGPGLAKREAKPVKFTFDHVFGPRATQEDVFNEVTHLVQSALDGYNVCLFSYGQTGSGKTHTMQGGSGDQAGLIPRSVAKILQTAACMTKQGWKFAMEASFLEIYNENIRDLLRVPKSATAAKDEPASLSIVDINGAIDVPGLTKMSVADAEAVDILLARAAKRRAVAATNMNAVSSRSHSVFTLYIRGEHASKGIAVLGTLNLCDLAGSERLSRSQAEGDRKKETAAINKSLSCLADVFTSLAKKTAHVPFRNSKLTHLLQNCFRGDGKTLMLVNLAPGMTSAHESMCSLRFASQVSQIELGKPKKKVVETLPIHAVAPSTSSLASAQVEIDDRTAPSSAPAHDDEQDNDSMTDDEMEAANDMYSSLAVGSIMKDAAAFKIGDKRPASAMQVTAKPAAATATTKRTVTAPSASSKPSIASMKSAPPGQTAGTRRGSATTTSAASGASALASREQAAKRARTLQ